MLASAFSRFCKKPDLLRSVQVWCDCQYWPGRKNGNYAQKTVQFCKKTAQKIVWFSVYFVRAKGIEPIRLPALDPKSSLSTNFNTPAMPVPVLCLELRSAQR
jgi:hypothetical protein